MTPIISTSFALKPSGGIWGSLGEGVIASDLVEAEPLQTSYGTDLYRTYLVKLVESSIEKLKVGDT